MGGEIGRVLQMGCTGVPRVRGVFKFVYHVSILRLLPHFDLAGRKTRNLEPTRHTPGIDSEVAHGWTSPTSVSEKVELSCLPMESISSL